MNIKKTRAYLLAHQMNENGLIDIIGRGAAQKYKLSTSKKNVEDMQALEMLCQKCKGDRLPISCFLFCKNRMDNKKTLSLSP